MDTIVDPVEMVSASSGHLEVAPAVAHPGPRPTFPSIDTDASVQWFERVSFDPEPASSIDVEVAWDDELDAEPTLVLRRPF